MKHFIMCAPCIQIPSQSSFINPRH